MLKKLVFGSLAAMSISPLLLVGLPAMANTASSSQYPSSQSGMNSDTYSNQKPLSQSWSNPNSSSSTNSQSPYSQSGMNAPSSTDSQSPSSSGMSSSDNNQQPTSSPAAVNSTSDSYQTSPFNLAELAYRGYFKEQGIPAYYNLVSDYRAGRVTVQDIIQSGIRANKVSPDVLNNAGYVNALDAQLRNLRTPNS